MFALRALALVLAASAALTAAARGPATIFDLADRIGKPAPAITLSAGDGGALTLGAADGKPTYVFLFAGWCGPCQESLPFVRSAFVRYGERVRFVGVDVLEDGDAARAAVARAALPFAVAIYPIDQLDAIVAPDVQLRSGMKYRIPADVLLDAKGVVRYVWHGLATNAEGEPYDLLPSYLAKLDIR